MTAPKNSVCKHCQCVQRRHQQGATAGVEELKSCMSCRVIQVTQDKAGFPRAYIQGYETVILQKYEAIKGHCFMLGGL